MNNKSKVSLDELRKKALYRQVYRYVRQGYQVVSETDTDVELIGAPKGGCLIEAPLSLMVFLSFLSTPVLYVLTLAFGWLFSRPFSLLSAKIRGLIAKSGFGQTETVLVISLFVDDKGRVREHRRLRDLK